MDGAFYNNRNIVLNELIGLKARVLACSDRKQMGLEGTILDETKNTLLLDTGKGARRVVKASSTFRIWAGGGARKSFVVEGREIRFRPDERIEKALKFYKRRKL